MLILDSENCPDSTTCDFREGSEEGDECAVLQVVRVDRVEDPIEAQDWIDDHGGVVVPCRFVAADVAEEALVSVRLKERPVHEEIPNGYGQ